MNGEAEQSRDKSYVPSVRPFRSFIIDKLWVALNSTVQYKTLMYKRENKHAQIILDEVNFEQSLLTRCNQAQ